MLCFSLVLSFLALPFTGMSEDLLTAAPGNTSSFFTDVGGDQWFYPYVFSLHGKDILKGKTETEFYPQDKLSVCELAALICRYHNLDGAAEERRAELIKNNITGADLWYSGYISLMVDGGIITEGEFNISTKDGYVILSKTAQDSLNSPVLRSQAADMIARSFELDPYHLESRAMKPEVSVYGHNFIAGGGYDFESLDSYVKDIKDFDSVDEKYRLSVKKCYYNGIFCGDNLGNFNPNNPLTRAEAAKIISCTLDFSLRIRQEYRTINSGILSFYEDGESLTLEAKKALLEAYGGFITFSENNLKMTLQNITPFGYYVEVIVNRQVGSRFYTAYSYSLCTPSIDYPTYPFYIEVSALYDNQPCNMSVLLILRNIRENGAIESVAEYVCDAQGNITSATFDIK